MPLPKLETPSYPGIIPSTGEKIQYRPFHVKEQKVLLLAMESGSNEQIYSAFKNILDVCVTSPESFRAENLASFDAESVFLQISGKSRGEKSDVVVNCDHCGHKNPVSVVLNDVTLKNKDKMESNKKIQLTDDVGIEFQYPSLKTIIKEQNEQQESASDIENAFSMIRSSIRMIYDAENVYMAEDTSKNELNEFLDSLTTEQMSRIEKFFDEMPYLAIDKKFKCGECGTLNEKELKGIQNFF